MLLLLFLLFLLLLSLFLLFLRTDRCFRFLDMQDVQTSFFSQVDPLWMFEFEIEPVEDEADQRCVRCNIGTQMQDMRFIVTSGGVAMDNPDEGGEDIAFESSEQMIRWFEQKYSISKNLVDLCLLQKWHNGDWNELMQLLDNDGSLILRLRVLFKCFSKFQSMVNNPLLRYEMLHISTPRNSRWIRNSSICHPVAQPSVSLLVAPEFHSEPKKGQ